MPAACDRRPARCDPCGPILYHGNAAGGLPRGVAAGRAGGRGDRGPAGFVGVDFVWDHERAHATILEINPRPTTSIVALCRLLPPGRLARAWLDACEGNEDSPYLDGLVEAVHGCKSISFSTEEASVVNP